MKTLVSVKRDLEFNRGLASLIEVLKTIAVSQYKVLERKMTLFREFLTTAESFFDFVDLKSIPHPFMSPGSATQAVVAVTSDTGLLGGLNMRVVTAALRELEKIPGRLIVVGERGKVYARESGVPFTAFPGISDEERYGQAMQLRDYVVGKVLDGSIAYLTVAYPRPISFTVQHVEVVPLLPYTPPDGVQAAPVPISQIIMESNVADVVEYLVYLWIGQKLYEVFGLSRLAEFAARFVHLEDSSRRLKEIDEKTRREYFRLRHELIDRNMRELFAARLLFTSK